MCSRFAIAVTFLSFIVACNSSPGVDENLHSVFTSSHQHYVSLIRGLRSAEVPAPDHPVDQLSADKFWYHRASQVRDEVFGEILVRKDKNALCDLFNRFGNEDAEFDFLLLYGGTCFFLPICGDLLDDYPFSVTKHGFDGTTYREFLIDASRCVVLRIINDAELRDRYYRAFLWARPMPNTRLGLRQSAIDTLQHMRIGAADDDFWFYARNVILIIHATGRDDLLKDVTPDDLPRLLRVWFAWYMDESVLIRIDDSKTRWHATDSLRTDEDDQLPWLERPFDDWKGPIPSHGIIDSVGNILPNALSKE